MLSSLLLVSYTHLTTKRVLCLWMNRNSTVMFESLRTGFLRRKCWLVAKTMMLVKNPDFFLWQLPWLTSFVLTDTPVGALPKSSGFISGIHLIITTTTTPTIIIIIYFICKRLSEHLRTLYRNATVKSKAWPVGACEGICEGHQRITKELQ